MRHRYLVMLAVASFGAVSGCGREPSAPAVGGSGGGEVATPTNRVDINSAVRQNLGITFAKVETRNVARTLRVPGRFELQPTALREYRAPAPGKVEILVKQYERVEAGTPLYRLDMARWRELQRELTDAAAAIALAEASAESIRPYREAHEKHHTEIQISVDLWSARVAALEQLRSSGGARGEDISQAKAELARARTDFAETLEKEADLNIREREANAQLVAARARRSILLATAASLTNRSVEELTGESGGAPRWQSIDVIEIKAAASGVVDVIHTTSGSTLDESGAILTTVQPDQVRFRARGLQSDLDRLRDGLPATVVPAQGGSAGSGSSMAGTLTLAPTADAERRTIELVMTPADEAPLPSWARAGVSAFLEVVVDGSGKEELAIPRSCVAHDGTQAIIFRRDPANPDKAIRMDADLGVDDGRWVVIKSGVAEGNEIVLNGVYQLMVATSGSITKGGHFHPDGTFHEGEH